MCTVVVVMGLGTSFDTQAVVRIQQSLLSSGSNFDEHPNWRPKKVINTLTQQQ